MNSDLSKKKKKYSTVIIGAGRIGSSFDDPSSSHILTHAHAVTSSARFELLGMSDVNVRQGRKEAKKWKTDFYESSEDMLSKIQPDVVVIASPDKTHAELIILALRYASKVIICEKPVITEKKEREMLESALREHDVPIVVNFSRRFDTEILRIRNELQKGKYGRVISANGIYTNGILHNGSHMLDLARFFFGEVREIKALGMTLDHGQDEPSVVGYVTFEQCPQFSLMSGDERAYAIFELEILTEKKRIRLENFGLELVIQDVVADPLYKGFKALSKRKIVRSKLTNALPELYRHAVDLMEEKSSSRSSLKEGLRTQEACFTLLDSISHKK